MISELITPKVLNFIQEHQDDDTAALMLSAHRYPDVPLHHIASLIKARQKAKEKIPLWYNNPKVLFPPGIAVEQSSSQLTALYKSNLIHGKNLIDLTGGMGVDTYFLSKNFIQTDYVEKQPDLCDFARYNFFNMEAESIHVHHLSAVDALKQMKHNWDWIYVDPARRDQANDKVYRLEDCQPNLIELGDVLLSRATNILIKASPMLDISSALESLKKVEKVVVISVKNEVKELLFMLGQKGSIDPEIETVNLKGGKLGSEFFTFYRGEEGQALSNLMMPQNYLYEPNAAILKAGGFKILGEKLAINKLHQHTHLYTSEYLLKNFPGRRFKIIAVTKLDKKDILKVISNSKAHISTRNFPMSVDQIRKKTGIKPGGDYYLFATTNELNKPIIIIAEKAKPNSE